MTDFISKPYDLDNGRGDMLSAILEYPKNTDPTHFAIFANCFTCEKNFFAPKRVCRALAARGIASVRFDFTGLGESGGDFSDTNFTTNLQDMRAIADKLNNEFGRYPSLLMGHSFGGAAAIGLAAELREHVKTIATIGSPKDPRHVMRHFEDHEQLLERNGQIEINVAGRTFVLKEHFAEDVKSHDIETETRNHKGALFVFHDTEDDMVKYQNAIEIFERGGGENYLVTLEEAGHMLAGVKHTDNVANILADWILKNDAPIGPHIQHRSG